MKDLDDLAIKILGGLNALPEEKMRLGLIGRTLAGLSPDDAARLIDIIYSKKADEGAKQRARAVLVDNDGLREAIGAEKYREIYLASIRLGLAKVSRLFTDLPPRRHGPSGYENEEDIKMEHLTLGERRALSRKPVGRTMERLLSDPDPMVVENLLNNPRMTEREVLKIVSKRPNSPRILKIAALHRVWSKRYDVAKAIARNPYTPPRVAIAFLEGMLTQDLKKIADDKTLHPQVKQAAAELVKDREKKRPS